MVITYESRLYAPHLVRSRYVQKRGDAYHFCEVNERRYDIRQGTVPARDIPADIRLAADKLAGFFPSYVEWPR